MTSSMTQIQRKVKPSDFAEVRHVISKRSRELRKPLVSSQCIFCKIAKGEIPSEIIYEDDKIMAFKNIKPASPFHYLIIPKKHIDSIANLDEKDKEDVSAVIYGAKKVAEKLGLKGYKLVFNVEKEGGQVIFHLHLHLLGGWTKQEDIDRMPHPDLDSENRK
jgi:histidine triad (HIT) family protein